METTIFPKYRQGFNDVGIENEIEMVLIGDFLESIAQICYDYYMLQIRIRDD